MSNVQRAMSNEQCAINNNDSQFTFHVSRLTFHVSRTIDQKMSLKNKINEDLNTAMKSKDNTRVDTLRSIRAEILKMDKSGMNREMTEEEELQLLSRQAKMRRESIELFQNAGRQDLVDKENSQLKIINEYLPEQMSGEEADIIITKILADTGITSQKDFGKAMAEAMKQLKGKIDGKVIQEILKRKLSE